MAENRIAGEEEIKRGVTIVAVPHPENDTHDVETYLVVGTDFPSHVPLSEVLGVVVEFAKEMQRQAKREERSH